MPAKQLKMSLLQVFSEMTTQRNAFGQNSCAADQPACVKRLGTRITQNLRSFSATFEKHEETVFKAEFEACYCGSSRK